MFARCSIVVKPFFDSSVIRRKGGGGVLPPTFRIFHGGYCRRPSANTLLNAQAPSKIYRTSIEHLLEIWQTRLRSHFDRRSINLRWMFDKRSLDVRYACICVHVILVRPMGNGWRSSIAQPLLRIRAVIDTRVFPADHAMGRSSIDSQSLLIMFLSQASLRFY